MYQNCCKKCGSITLYTEEKGNNVGLYCDDCGAWIKWLGKDELRAFNHAKQSQKDEPKSDDNYKKKYWDIVNNLKDFVGFIDQIIDSEMGKLPLSDADAIRKNSYCLALERDKNAILNILQGKDFKYIEK